MSNTIRIAQITDCHLPADPDKTYRGIYPYANLERLLDKVIDWKPDLLLATGDLSEDGSPASYGALQQFFRPLQIPVLALPGNHDEAGLLDKNFPGSPVNNVQVSTHDSWQIIRLNSCLPGKPHGELGAESLDGLKKALKQGTGRPRVLAVHHQPLEVGSPWIDKYRMFGPEAFLELIDQHEDIKAVVWGHVHQVFDQRRNSTAMLGSPSSAINSLPGASKFTPDPAGPAFRWLELGEGGALKTGIISVDSD